MPIPETSGTRALVRLAGMKNFDIGVAKSFPLPWEGHRIQFRAEAYNAFNNVNFIQPSLALSQSWELRRISKHHATARDAVRFAL